MPIAAWDATNVPFRKDITFEPEAFGQPCLASKAADQRRMKIVRFIHGPTMMALCHRVNSGYLPPERKICRWHTARTTAGLG
jgi:hypothetical protein